MGTVALELPRAGERLSAGEDHAVRSGLAVSPDAFYAEAPEVVVEFCGHPRPPP